MGVADLLAQALRQRTGKRVYGSAHFEDDIRKRQAAAEMDALEQDTGEFKLASSREKLPLELEALEALAGQRTATTGLTEAKTATEEVRPDLMREGQELARLKAEQAREMDPLKKLELEARIKLMGAQADKAARPPVAGGGNARPGAGLQLGVDTEGNQVVVDKAAGTYRPITAAPPHGAPPAGPGAPPSAAPRTLKKPPPSGEADKRAMLTAIISDLDTLEGLATGGAKDAIGFGKGHFIGATRKVIPQSSDVNDLFHISDNLNEQLLRARTGAAVSPGEFERSRNLVPDPRGDRKKFFDDLRRFRLEMRNSLAARQGQAIGGVSPTVSAPPAAPKSKSRFIVEEVQ